MPECSHGWGDPGECPMACGDDRCAVQCRTCGEIDVACDD